MAVVRSFSDAGLLAPLLVGLGVRMVVLAFGLGMDCTHDECAYAELTRVLLDGHGVQPYGGHLWAPGYVSFLALHGLVVERFVDAAKLTQVLLSVASLALLYDLARSIFDRRIAALAAWIFALYPTLIAFTHYLWPETLYIVLLLLSLRLALEAGRAAADPGRALVPWAVAAGVALGATCHVKPLPLYFVPVLAVWLFVFFGRNVRAVTAGLLVAGTVALTLIPWTVHAYRQYGRAMIVEATIGENLWRGNNHFLPPNADWGMPRPLEGGYPACKDANFVDQDRCNVGRALGFVRGHPALFLRRVPFKLADLWGPNSFLIRHLHFGLYGETPRVVVVALSALTVASYAAVVVGAVLGLAFAVGGPNRSERVAWVWLVMLLVLYYCAVHALVFGMSRFRLPLMPLLFPFAAMAWTERRRLGELRQRPAALAAIATVLLLFAASWSGRWAPIWEFPAR
ncbi:MAG: glycosyltransferase family 39 protein [Myxococcales bacterium]|nr:glycosyltransferase family 39 protein [Myxococcales bacterium]